MSELLVLQVADRRVSIAPLVASAGSLSMATGKPAALRREQSDACLRGADYVADPLLDAISAVRVTPPETPSAIRAGAANTPVVGVRA